MNSEKHSKLIKNIAKKIGFLSCRIAKAEFLEEEAPRLEKWLNQGMHGSMSYMERNFDKRLDPRKLVPGAKSVVSLSYNYYTKENQKDPKAPKISKYAFGKDYHFIIKEKLRKLLLEIKQNIGNVEGRVFVDSAPILERAWAKKSGLGWVGKNTNVITKEVGSYYFLAELIIDLDLYPDPPVTDHCGSCTACIDACPTEAIIEPYKLDGSKCISYLTIELKSEIPKDFSGKMDNWMFGCDICQDVCPWNRFSKPHLEPAFNANNQILNMGKKEWEELTKETFNKVFKNSAIKRTKYDGLVRNISFLKEKVKS